jgi:hypothetical protein
MGHMGHINSLELTKGKSTEKGEDFLAGKFKREN